MIFHHSSTMNVGNPPHAGARFLCTSQSMSEWADRRREAFKRTMAGAGLTSAAAISRATGVSAATIRSYLNGYSDTLNARNERKIASALGLNPAALYGESYEPVKKRIWVKGFVGAGATVQVMDGMGENDGLYEVAHPPGILPSTDLVAYEIRGLSMPPAADRWIIYCLNRDAIDPAEVIGKACIVETKAGELLFKVVRRGYTFGRYNLESWDGSPLREDVELVKAQPFVSVADPSVAKR